MLKIPHPHLCLPRTGQDWIPLVPPVPGDYWRERLAAAMFDKSRLPTHESLQAKLRSAGFTGVYVYPNSPAVDPALFLQIAYNMTCDELLPSGNDAQCGEVEAQCAIFGGELLVNGEIYEQGPNYTQLCGEVLVQCDEAEALAGNFDSIYLDPIEYDIPVDPGYWPLIFFVGGVANGADNADAGDDDTGTAVKLRVGFHSCSCTKTEDHLILRQT
jgi:hypothetical protein